MANTDARTIANRENARKSTGPRTAEGKARSRANAVKHGLAGQGVAWPGEDEGAMEAFVAGQVELDRPQDAREAWLARRAAVSAWQVERGEAMEAMNARILAAGAVDAELEHRAAEVEFLVGLLGESPARAVRGLLRTVDGCEWVLAALWDSAEGIEEGRWADLDIDRIDALCRPTLPGLMRVSRAGALARALASGDTSLLRPAGNPGPGHAPDRERQGWQADLSAILLRRISEVEALLAALRDRPDPALEYAALAASFDQSPAGERIRRYNRANLRQREKSLQELAAWRASREEREDLPVRPEHIPQPSPPAEPSPSPQSNEVMNTSQGQDVATNWLRFAGDVGGPGREAPIGDPARPDGLRDGPSGGFPGEIRSA